MKHTFLLEEGTWESNGTYYDERGNAIPVWGRMEISHTGTRWYNRGLTRLLLEKPVEYRNDYEIDPLAPGEEFTAWQSFNPQTGTLWGSFMFVGDSILSSFTSENSEYRGHEYLLQIDEDTYRNRGFSFRGDEKLSSWTVELKRVKPAPPPAG